MILLIHTVYSVRCIVPVRWRGGRNHRKNQKLKAKIFSVFSYCGLFINFPIYSTRVRRANSRSVRLQPDRLKCPFPSVRDEGVESNFRLVTKKKKKEFLNPPSVLRYILRNLCTNFVPTMQSL